MIEVGEYCRIDNGIIIKYEYKEIYNNEFVFGEKGKCYSFEDEEEFEDFVKLRIVKHNKNIIDLLGAGDYVNGDLVVARDKNSLLILTDRGQACYKSLFEEKKIKSIVTSEQFKSVEYRI